MPLWDGIEDATPSPLPVWLSREKDTDAWKPLRKVDCRLINSNTCRTEGKVQIECGRATADIPGRTISYNFFNAPTLQLAAATWFWKEEKGSKGSKDYILRPLSERDDKLVEKFYQRILEASSSLGEGLNTVLREEIMLEDDKEFKVVILKSGGTLSLKKRTKNFFGPSFSLQRGYGSYTVEGEEDELALGPVSHLIFVVHGIGEAMWSREGSSVPNLVTEVNQTRARVCKKQVAIWKKNCEKAKAKKEELPAPPNRVEILPIEWYSRIHSGSSSVKRSLISSTLLTVPKLRAIANDVVFDVLMYLTPEFCEEVLDCVTTQIIDLYAKFKAVHQNFIANEGRCSLIGHSLGSVIVWDMLCNLQQNNGSRDEKGDSVEQDKKSSFWPFADLLCGYSLETTDGNSNNHLLGYQAYIKDGKNLNEAEAGTWGPVLPKKMAKVIPFVPEFTIFLGSPLGMFLTLRGARPVFNDMRKHTNDCLRKLKAEERKKSDGGGGVSMDFFEMVEKTEETITSPFRLPTKACYNIFHPSDPVAYRIEPLLLPPETPDECLPPPEFLTVGDEGVRLHVKAKELGGNLFRGMSGLFSTIDKVVVTASERSTSAKNATEISLIEKAAVGDLKFALGGTSSRVDYQLQPGVVDNEYISAITAHSSYFTNDDLLDFIIEQTRPREEKKV